jgi:hypothetical protein
MYPGALAQTQPKTNEPLAVPLIPLLSSWDQGEKNSAVATGDVLKQPAGLSRPLKGIGSKLVAKPLPKMTEKG